MRRLLTALACVLLAWTPAAAQVMKLHPAPGSAVVASSTWDPALANAGIMLSVGNTKATNSSGSDANFSVIGTAALSGKRYFEIVCTLCNLDGSFGLVLEVVGVANASQVNNDYLGHSGDSGGNQGNANIIYGFGIQGPDGVMFVTASVIGVAMDTATKKVWFTINGSTWAGSAGADDPVTGTGGMDLSGVPVVGPFFPAATVHTAGNALTLRTGSGFTYSIPSGFSAAP